MPKSTQNKIENRSVLLAVVLFLVIWGLSIWVCLGPLTDGIKARARHNWPIVHGRLIQVSRVQGDSSNPYIVGTVSYRDLSGRQWVVKDVLSYAYSKGDEIDVYVDRSGDIYVPADLNSDTLNDPRSPDPSWPIPAGMFGGCGAGLVGAFLAYMLLCFVQTMAWKLWNGPPVIRVVRSYTRRSLLWGRDLIKLQWEFTRRRKRLNATPEFKAARRFQAELERMNPPKGINQPEALVKAKRKANQLLTEVLERDTVQAGDVAEQIDAIREEVDADITARKQALEELRQREA